MNAPCQPLLGAIEASIRSFLAEHPKSPTLMVAQSLWVDSGKQTRSVYIDSWLWIRQQMELLAKQGALRRDSDGWSLA